VHHAARPASGGCRAVYVVRSGDSLWSIAHHSTQRGTIHDWQALYAANRAAIGANPSYLTVGEQLCLSRH
jgi:nucleoid-associated protein YgaU